VEIEIAQTVAMRKNGALVLSKKARVRARQFIAVGKTVTVMINGSVVGERTIDSDYRINLGKALSELIRDNSIIKLKVSENNVEVNVS
jgi:hypothetical protein